jgi:poly(hydroxyalkanoate) depolymerase family esterase
MLLVRRSGKLPLMPTQFLGPAHASTGGRMTGETSAVRTVATATIAMLIALSTLSVVGPQVAYASPTSGKAQTFTFGSGQAAHSYIVYTPRGWTADKRMPLVVMLHGCQTNAYQQMKASLYNPLADKMGFVVVYPDTDAAENAQPGPLVRCWQFYLAQDSKRGQGDGAVVARITRKVMRRWNIDRQRVYVMGMSAGAFLSANLAAEYPGLYAASGENAGGAYADPGCLLGGAGLPVAATAAHAFAEMGKRARVVPRIVLGGDADSGVTPGCADNALLQSLRTNNLVIDGQQAEPIQLNPASIQSEQVPGGYSYLVSNYVDKHGCLIGQRYLVHGMNHFWSGGSSNPRWADFTDPKGPSAAVASWQFLSRFTLSNTQRSCHTSTSSLPR